MKNKHLPIALKLIFLGSILFLFSFSNPLDTHKKENTPPVFTLIDDIEMAVFTTQTVEIEATDANDIFSMNLPSFASLEYLGNGLAQLILTPEAADLGEYFITLGAINGDGLSSMTIQVTVTFDDVINFNPPVFNPVNNIVLNSDNSTSLIISASNATNITVSNMPSFMTFIYNGGGEGILTIEPNGGNEGNYSLQFYAHGDYGNDDLDLFVFIETPIIIDTIPPDPDIEIACELTFLETFSTQPNFENLFDEFSIAGDPASGAGGNPITAWTPSWELEDFPVIGYIDLGSMQDLSKLYLFDVNGSGTFNIYTGTSPANMNPTPIITDDLTSYQIWKEHELNVETQYLFFEMESPLALVSEIMIYGNCNIIIDTIPPFPISDLELTNITTNSASLSWSPAGDDGHKGRASSYEIRYSTEPITDGNYYDLPIVQVDTVPYTDTIVTTTIEGLYCNTIYYFAMKAIDNVGNPSPISNLISDTTGACNGDITITITYDTSLVETPEVLISRLRYNKAFAYSLTLDDGSVWEYNVTFPIMNGGLTPDGEEQPGYFYTDGCGNDIAFKAGVAINGQHILDEPFEYTFMAWSEVKTLFDAGWDIINHGYSHCSYTCSNYNAEVSNNVAIVQEKLGFTMSHFAVPSADTEGYRWPAFNNGMKAIHDQHFLMPGEGGLQIDTAMDMHQFELFRNTLEFETPPYGGDIDSVAMLTDDGEHYWFSEYAHRVGYPGEPFIFVLADDFIDYMSHMENLYGRFGDDKIWVAPVQEVYEYIQIRDNAIIENISTSGNEMTISLDMSNIPLNLRRYALSLQLRTSNFPDICDVEVTGADYHYNIDGLINLNW